MLRFFILRIVLPLLLFLLVRSVFKSLVSAVSAKSSARGERPGPADFRAGGELKRDPVCGTFIPVSTAVTESVNGELLHFCSTACRDRYRAA